jgi:hypothetical protein
VRQRGRATCDNVRMTRSKLILVAAGLLCAACAFAQVTPDEAKQGFRPIFNGKSLDGWDGDPRLWSVHDGAIVGSTEGVKLTHNTFLVYKENFSNFVFRAQVKLRNHNSGIQFRSQTFPEWVVKGYQADIAEGAWWGSIYEEGGKRGVLANGWAGKGEKVVRANDWNDYEIFAKGDMMQLTLNGLVTATIWDNLHANGIIALQLHAGPAMQASFRNIRIKTIPQ